ncbi:MAG: rhomboid family intramembrane serine protease [Lentisphaeria bacterium]|nr:rhomboid family intramembrane serine protease [Lentisphaeria bacterium]
MGMFNNFSQGDQENGANKTIFGIICVTVLFFILVQPGVSGLFGKLILAPAALKDFQLWRIISSLLVNISGWNLFFEMFALYIFGTIITPRLGAAKILSLYLCSGIAGNLLWLLLNFKNPEAAIFGCSGAVYGIIMASAMMVPEMQMYLLFIPFPVKLRTMAVVFMLIDLLLMGATPFALLDVGGFIGGYLFMRLILRKEVQWDPLDSLLKRKPVVRNTPYEFKQNPKNESGSPVNRNEVDRILDKLSRTGINSLTPEEIAVLEKVREQMNRKN